MGTPRAEQQVQTQSWAPLHANLARVNDAAKRSRQTRFTALFHHLDIDALERAFRRLRRRAAPGVDGMTMAAYEQGLGRRTSESCTPACMRDATGPSLLGVNEETGYGYQPDRI